MLPAIIGNVWRKTTNDNDFVRK